MLKKNYTTLLLTLSWIFTSSSLSFGQNLLPYEDLQTKKVFSKPAEIEKNINDVYRVDITFWKDSNVALIYKIPNLQQLTISHLNIPLRGDRHPEIDYSKMPNLQILDMNVNQQNIPESIFRLQHLKFLQVSGVRKFPADLSWFKQLKVFELAASNKEEVRVWEGLHEEKVELKLAEFRKMLCRSNQPWNGYFTSFDLANKHKESVTRFRLCKKEGIERLSELKNYPNLKLLTMYGEDLESIPTEIYDLSGLEELRLINCKVKNIPAGISNMKSLKTLNLSTNLFETFPKDFFKLSNLEELTLHECANLKTVPKGISKLTNLRKLSFGLENGGDTYGGTNTTPLSSIPEGIYKLNKLEYLGLACTNIVDFPDDINKLTSLKTLTINWFNDEVVAKSKEVRKRFSHLRVY